MKARYWDDTLALFTPIYWSAGVIIGASGPVGVATDARWRRRSGHRLRSDAGRNQGACQPVRWALAGRDRRNTLHWQNDGKDAPRTHLLKDRGHAPSRADASVDRADLPDRI